MKISQRSALFGFAIGLAVPAAGVQAAGQASQHQLPAPAVQKPAAPAVSGMEGMKDMHAMMSDPVMREKMMANMAQCRDMMSMMMEHMKHEGMKKGQVAPHP
jgi:hypothetical protein